MSRAKLHCNLVASMRICNRREQLRRYRGGRYQDAETIGNYKIEYIDEGRDMYVMLWNPDRPCVVLVMDTQDKTAQIEHIEYDSRCTVSGHMQRGHGTKDMIDFMIELARSHGITKIQLMDKTSVKCRDGREVLLGLMHFIKYGMTWYEKYFGFKVVGKNALEYQHAKEIRKTMNLPFLTMQSCEYFIDHETELLNALGIKHISVFEWEKNLE